MQSLNYKEYVDIEDKKDILFEKRLEYICLAESFYVAMIRETGYTQMKRFFKAEYLMEDGEAGRLADKYNLAHRVYEKFDKIVENCEKCKFDIRDLSLKEMPLVYAESGKVWLIRRKALSRGSNHQSDGKGPDVNWQSVQETVDLISGSDWFKSAKANPFQVAYIMNEIGRRVVAKSHAST